MRENVNIMYPDYKKIRNESCRINCMITQEDFYTNYPNPYRIDYIARDISDYKKRCKMVTRTFSSER